MYPLLLCLLAGACTLEAAVEPDIATFSFDTLFDQPDALAKAKLPEWVVKLEQQGGRFSDDPRCWQVAAGGPDGTGRIEITLDREKMPSNLIATVLFDAAEGADLAVQLFDREGRVIVVDLFGNLVEVGRQAATDTFVIPWKKYPTADKIVLRRISGALKVYGLVVYPVVTEGTPVKGALEELAKVLGDPLSPENPMLENLQEIAKGAKVGLHAAGTTPPTVARQTAPSSAPTAPTAPSAGRAATTVRESYPAAVAPAKLAAPSPPPTAGLVAHWSFDAGDGADASGRGHTGVAQAGATFVASPHGKALRLRKAPSPAKNARWDTFIVPPSPALEGKETLTVAAWMRYASIAPASGSQIVWHGDAELGRDPWLLHLLPGGILEFRSDRSVSGRPAFTVLEEEIYFTPEGRLTMAQHVGAESPGSLDAGKWYFVAGTLEKAAPRASVLRLFVNGEPVSEARTEERVNYPTAKMWTEIGACDSGSGHHFDGEIDDVRIYDRALSPIEIKALYNQPWN